MAPNALQEMLVNPSKHVKAPSEALSVSELSKDEKIAVLKQWALDARLLMVAVEEGMSGGEPNLLRSVNAALASLGVVAHEDDGPGVN